MWRNSGTDDLSGQCCDCSAACDVFFCSFIVQECATKFSACLTTSQSTTPCALRPIIRDPTIYKTSQTTTTVTPGEVFSFSLSGLTWPASTARIQVEAHDEDGPTQDDLVLQTTVDPGLLTPGTRRTISKHLSGGDFLQLEVLLVCQANYWGSSCSTFCNPGASDRYSCDLATGAKICAAGWSGSNCDIDSNACTASPCGSPHATCTDLPPPAGTSATGRVCECLPGYSGNGEACSELDACELSPCPSDTSTSCVDLPPPADGSALGRTCCSSANSTSPVCTDQDACALFPCGDHTTCTDLDDAIGAATTAAGRNCSCRLGFESLGAAAGADGALTCAPVCGDGLLVEGEDCEDGGRTDGDGCSATCKLEAGWVCSSRLTSEGLCVVLDSGQSQPYQAAVGVASSFPSALPVVTTAGGLFSNPRFVADSSAPLPAGLALDAATGRFHANFSAPSPDTLLVEWQLHATRAGSAQDTVLALPPLSLRVLGTTTLLPTQLRATAGQTIQALVPAIVGAPVNATPALVALVPLPAGLALTTTAGLHGQPQASGVVQWQIAAGAGAAAVAAPLPNIDVSVAPALVVSAAVPASSADTVVAVDFGETNVTVVLAEIQGGRPPLALTSLSASLPSALTVQLLDRQVVLVGDATATGTYAVDFSVRDANAATATLAGLDVVVKTGLIVTSGTWRDIQDLGQAATEEAFASASPLSAPLQTMHSEGAVIIRAASRAEVEQLDPANTSCGALVGGELPAGSGLAVDPASGAVQGTPAVAAAGVLQFCLVVQDTIGRLAALGAVRLVVELSDCTLPANGPGGRGCGAGVCVDSTKLDGAFSCNCSAVAVVSAGALDANCSPASTGSAAGSAAGLAAGVVVAVLVLVAVGAGIWWHRRRRSGKTTLSAPPGRANTIPMESNPLAQMRFAEGGAAAAPAAASAHYESTLTDATPASSAATTRSPSTYPPAPVYDTVDDDDGKVAPTPNDSYEAWGAPQGRAQAWSVSYETGEAVQCNNAGEIYASGAAPPSTRTTAWDSALYETQEGSSTMASSDVDRDYLRVG